MDDAALAKGMRQLLIDTGKFGASDLHLSAGSSRSSATRALTPITEHALTDQEALRLNTVLLAEHQKTSFSSAATSTSPSRWARRTATASTSCSTSGARRAPTHGAGGHPQARRLGLRNLDAIRKLLSYHNGLILITGPVGAGKTTTLAAMVAELNEQRQDHIITVEDPIEVVQTPKGCNVTQREVGPHTKSFFSALKGALREDPDVIIIGELRDLETIEMAISASETGHLVIAPCTRAMRPRRSTACSTSSRPHSRRRSAPPWPSRSAASSASACCPRPTAASSSPARS